jgi:DNA-binding Lrp family transcriptional regulator
VKSGAQTYNIIQVLTTYKSHGFVLERLERQSTPLTSKDWELLSVIRRGVASTERPYPLTQDQIGRAMNPPLSQPAVSKAMQRLESRNIIVGYSAHVDFKRAGLPIKFFLEIRPKPGRIANAAQVINEMPQVWDLHRVSQDYGLFATVRTESVDAYNSFIRELYTHDEVLDTQSQISLEEWFLLG